MSGPGDTQAIIQTEVQKVLGKYFLGYEYDDGRPAQEHLQRASLEVVTALMRFFHTDKVRPNRLGATVMTESSSMRNGKDGFPGIPPRTL